MIKVNPTAWKYDLIVIAAVVIGFEMIDSGIEAVSESPLYYYYDFLVAAKWLLIGGFTLHGILSFLVSRTGK